MANVSIYAAFERMWQHFIAKLSSKADVDSIPTSTSQLENDSGFLTSYTETDPTVPEWAKAETKPSYTADEVGAAEAEHTHDDYALKTDILSLDTTLSVEGAAADAKAVGDAIANISYTETDPTVPDWAKAETKPSYYSSEITVDTENMDEPTSYIEDGTLNMALCNLDNALYDLDVALYDVNDNLVNNYVKSSLTINDKPLTDKITLTASDVGAAETEHTHDEYVTEEELTAKGYLTEHQDLSAYAKTADLGDLATKDSLTASDVGADASGTAENLVEAHNNASDAHNDIRADISNLSLEIASIHDEVYIGSGTPTNGEKIQIDPDGDGSTLTIPDVLQTTGDSTVDTMSQKAITDALSNATVSDEQIATAVENYIAENPISGGNGEDGRGIVSTARTSGTGAAGTTDTYTITYTDDTTSTFTVYNGADGVDGKSAYEYAQDGGYTGTESAFTTALSNVANQTTETWTFTLEDGSTVSKTVVLL